MKLFKKKNILFLMRRKEQEADEHNKTKADEHNKTRSSLFDLLQKHVIVTLCVWCVEGDKYTGIASNFVLVRWTRYLFQQMF